ncbi:MAG: pitrilysin family protein [Gemmatales bacterium]
MLEFHHLRLANGLQVLGETNPSARSVAVGFFVRTGARDEGPDIAGVSHFLEHMAFKGTPKRTALDVNREFDAIGANHNAYTSEENTVFYAAVLPEYLPQAVDILADILRPSLRQDDFDMEKKVILEEISMYEDQPMWSAYDASKSLFFQKHPLGNRVLGTTESVGALTSEQMRNYFQNRYVAGNITVIATGNFDFKAYHKMVEERCASWTSGPTPRDLPAAGSPAAFQVIHKEKVAQEHLMIWSGGPPAASELRYAAEVLAGAIGDDTGSRLYWSLIDPGHADSADFSFHEYQGAGAYLGYVGGDPDEAQANLQRYLGVLKAVQADGISEKEMNLARAKLASRVVRGNERPMGRMASVSFNWQYLNQYRTVDDDLKAIDAVTLNDIRTLLDAYPIDNPTIVAYGPVKSLSL